MGTLLALLSAAGFGVGDFAAGLAGRRFPSAGIAGIVVAVEVLAALLSAALVPGAGPTVRALLWGALAGVGGGLGTLALYHGLSVGRMSVVATLSAVLAAVVPVIAGVALGDHLGPGPFAGVCLAIPSIALVSQAPLEPGGNGARAGRGSRAGLLAGLAFALLFIALDQAGTRSGAWPLVPDQLVSLLVISPFATRGLRRGGRPRGTTAALALAAGLLSGSAGLLYLLATGHGELSVVAVLTSLYPAVTVLLARGLLRERWSRAQAVGLVTAAVAIALVSG